ncbi:unnamed protein product [Closterium sp. NIES-65]|nr:unnamed protein product [Closterium sp. NIES-65]
MASPQIPSPANWANRAGREFDIVVFGASGFTGRFVLIEAMRVARSIVSGTPLPPHAPLRVAAAGRSRARVEQAVAAAEASVRKEAGGSAGPAASAGAAEQGEAGPGGVAIVVADVCDSASLAAMARRCCVLINCVGPFRFYGAPVVEACVAAGTDYVDVCGEPEFMERMAFAHHSAAVKAGCLVVSACGFDSVPADLGAQYTLRQLPPERAAAVAVDSYLSVSAPRGLAGHYATWESLVHGLASAGELRAIRREAAKSAAGGTRKPSSGNNSSSSSSSKGKLPPLLRAPAEPEGGEKGIWPLVRRWVLPVWPRWVGGQVNAWVLPFMGADASVVRRSLAAFQAAAAAQATAGAGAGAGGQGDVGAPAGGEDASGGQGETDALLVSPSSPPPESSASAALAAAAGAAASGAAVSIVQGTGLEALPVPCNAAAMVHYSAYFTVSSSFHVCLFLAFGALLKALTAVPFGIKLLLKYPSLFSFGVFSHEGPSPEQLACTRFRMLFEARGFSQDTLHAFQGGEQQQQQQRGGRGKGEGKGKRIRPIPDCHVSTVVSGPEMGYVVTPRIAVQSAVFLLTRSPATLPTGGVLPPAAAFHGGDRLWPGLAARGLLFETLRSSGV